MPNLKLKVLSSLEKCFYNDDIDSKPEKKEFIIFKNERLSFQVAFLNTVIDRFIVQCTVTLGGDLAKYTTVKQVGSVPVAYPAPFPRSEGVYIKKEPGLYPDIIRPLYYAGKVPAPYSHLQSLWLDVEPACELEAGNYTLSVNFTSPSKEDLGTVEVTVRIIDEILPEQELIHTEWFYTDCIAQYYNVKAFS